MPPAFFTPVIPHCRLDKRHAFVIIQEMSTQEIFAGFYVEELEVE